MDDRVTVERDFAGPPDPSYPPKGVVKEIEERYGIEVEDVEFPTEGRILVKGRAVDTPGRTPLHSGMGGV